MAFYFRMSPKKFTNVPKCQSFIGQLQPICYEKPNMKDTLIQFSKKKHYLCIIIKTKIDS